MKLKREHVLRYFCESYAREYEQLGTSGVDRLLDRGRTWDLRQVLRDGGVLVFPHVHIADCGHQTAAVVHACLDSGADQILALGVLHSSSEEMATAKMRVTAGETQPEDEPLRGIYGSGSTNSADLWTRDHSLLGFRWLLADAAERRGVKPPRLIERYPFLTAQRPETLPGIQEVQAISRDAAVISTADHCHHGIGYGDLPEESLSPDGAGVAEIARRVGEGLALLDSGDLHSYFRHCIEVVKSDWRDAGPLVHFLRSPLRSAIIDTVASDFSASIYEAPPPTWAAGVLVRCDTRISISS